MFHKHLLRWSHSSQVLTIQERWRFESIPNQLVIYSLHKSHSPAKVRYWSPSQLSRYLEFARNHMYPGADRLHFGLIISPPCPTTPAPAKCATGNLLGPKKSPSFAVGRYFIRPAKCKACIQHDSRPNNGRSLIDTDGKHYSLKLCKSPSGLNFI